MSDEAEDLPGVPEESGPQPPPITPAGLVWDVHNELALQKATAGEMADACEAAAHKIEGTQRALLVAGARSAPHMGEMERAARLWKAADLLRELEEVKREVAPIIRRLRASKKRG